MKTFIAAAIFVVVLVAASFHSKAQVQPYVYLTFEGDSAGQWSPWSSSSPGYTSPECNSTCQGCTMVLPAIPPVITNTFPATDNYALFSTANAQLRSNSVATISNNVSLEILVRFDDAFGIQRRANLFTLSRASGQSNPGTYLNFYMNFDLTATDGGAELVFYTDPNGSPSTDANTFSIDLNGLNRKSIQYYLDDKWHHIAITYNAVTGIKKIYIDGICPPEFSAVATPGVFIAPACSLFVNSTTTYDKMVGGLDEIAYYDAELSAEEVAQHYNDFLSHQHYTFQLTEPLSNNIALTSDVDANEFPYGHTVNGGENSSWYVQHNALEQLHSFSLPRFKPGHHLHKNMNLIRSKWIGNNSSSDVNVQHQTSLDVQIELASKWNYYFNLSENLSVESNDVNTPGTHGYNWMQWVADPVNTIASTFDYAVFTNRAQLPAGTLVKYQGFGTSANQQLYYSVKYDFINSQYIIPYKYLTRSGAVSTTKYWLPVSDINNYTGDGDQCKNLLNHILDRLQTTPLKLNYIAENNEVAPVYDANSYDQATQAPVAFKDNYEMRNACAGCNQQQWLEFLGDKKIAIDNTAYRNILLNDARLTQTNYLNYGTDGGPDDRYYWPKLRETQLYNNSNQGDLFKNAYSTMDFYPITPSRWRIQDSNLTIDDRTHIPRGWRWLARSRKTELAAGDKLFAPYVGAGWYKDEERNFRPGQWLGLMKCVGLTGVDFYHSYYDEINGNPKGFIWQVTIPSYAQAVLSRIDHMMLYGKVLEGNIYASPSVASQGFAYAFNTGNPLHLVTVRQDGDANGNAIDRFAITGTIQKIINMTGDQPVEEDVSIDLSAGIVAPDLLKFKIRRQGSTYILDRTRGANDIAFYQIDKWHQWEHPERWSKSIELEAEVFDNNDSLTVTIYTEDALHQAINNGDYRNFTSYISAAGNNYQYNFEPRQPGVYYLYIKARLKNASQQGNNLTASIISDSGQTTQLIKFGCISGEEWKWYMTDTSGTAVYYNLNAAPYILSLACGADSIYIDRIVISTDSLPPGNEPAVAEAQCSGEVDLHTVIKPVTCTGANTGSIKVIASGQGLNYDYSINQSPWFSSGDTMLYDNLTVGVYYLRARSTTDTTLISGLYKINITGPPVSFNLDLQVTDGCNNSHTGKITAVPTGGNLNKYDYLWSNGAISGTIENLDSGFYTVTVTDAMGCSITSTAHVGLKTFRATASVTSASTANCGSGTLLISIDTLNKGRPPYSYSLNDGIDFSDPSSLQSKSYSNQTAGKYLAQVMDYEGCVATLTGNPLIIPGTINAGITSSLTPTFILNCNGNKTSLTASPSGKYLWSTGQTSATISNLPGGTYQVTVTQTSGSLCSSKTVVKITEPEAITVDAAVTNVKCHGSADGTAVITASGGTGILNFLWSNGNNKSSDSTLVAGNYSVTVTDINSCIQKKYFTITQPAALLTATIDLLQPAICNQSEAIIKAQPVNGITPYTYLWNNNVTAAENAGLQNGVYTVTVTDAGGCSTTVSSSIQATGASVYYEDSDNDGYGNEMSSVIACALPPDYVSVGGDCNDASPDIHPSAMEICDGLDNDCDGLTDIYHPALIIRFMLQSLYIGGDSMMAVSDPVNYPLIADTVIIGLHPEQQPSVTLYSFIALLDIYGYVTVNIPSLPCGRYYVSIRHRNSVETWSKDPVDFNIDPVEFDFTKPH